MNERTDLARIDLKEYTYNLLKSRIINCVYEPGSIIYEQLLTNELGVSRTPVREALKKIEQEGFLRVMPKKGVMIKEITISSINEIFQVREELEPLMIKLAGPRMAREQLLAYRNFFQGDTTVFPASSRTNTIALPIDTQFHLYIIDNCGNQYLNEFMHRVFDHNTQMVIFSKLHTTKTYDAHAEHIQIIDLILAENYDKAGKVMRQHVNNNRRQLLEFILKYRPDESAL